MMADAMLFEASAVAIEGRALAIEGPSGSGKSTLVLSLIDRGAQLVGDDAVTLTREGDRLIASPPPNIAGKLEIRGVGIVDLPTVRAPLALIVRLAREAPRYPDAPPTRDLLGAAVPVITLPVDAGALSLRAEWALRTHGLCPDG